MGFIYREYKIGSEYGIKIHNLANNNNSFKVFMWIGGLILSNGMIWINYPQ